MSTFFNIHDIILLLTALGGLVLGLITYWGPSKNRFASYFLSIFFISVFVIAVCTLMFWSSKLRPLSMHVSGIMTVLYITAQLIKGPSLYFYVSSILDSNFKVDKTVLPHFIAPGVIALIFVLFGVGVEQVASYQTFLSTSVEDYGLKALMFYIPFCYACMCTRYLKAMKTVLKNYYSCFIDSGSKWFNLMVYGYVAFWGWRYLSHLFSGYLSLVWGDDVTTLSGLITNYLGFILFFSLFFYSISHAYYKLNTALALASQKEETLASDSQRCLAQIVNGIERDKLYLESNLNIERFSERIGEKTKEVSAVINDKFQSNFFEFINRYRVEEAKRLLVEDQSLNIIDVMVKSGFNSKSSFNRVFKRMTGKSPSQYRSGTEAVSLTE